MTKKLLVESAGKPVLNEDGSFRAVMITPGTGSSGVYSEAVLRRDAQIAFPPGTVSWINHPSESNPTRDPRDMFGTYPEGGHYEEGVGIVGRFVPLPHMREFAEAVAPHAALSIYAMGESDFEGNVTALLPDMQNSVDLVGYPGRAGSGLTQMYEAAISAAPKERTATVADEKKETKMTPEQEAKLDKLAEAFAAFVTESSAAPREKETPSEDAIAAAVSEARKATVAAIEAVNGADLPDAIRKNLVSAIEDGKTDIAPLVESAKETVDALRAELKEQDERPRGFVLREDTNRKVEAADDESRASWTALFGGK